MTIGEQGQGEMSTGPEHRSEDLVLAADRAGRVVRDQVAAIVAAAASNGEQLQRRSEEAAANTSAEATAAVRRVLELIRSIEREVEDLRRTAARESDVLRGKLGKAAVRVSALALPAGVPHTVDAEATVYNGGLETEGDRESSSSGPPTDTSSPLEPAPAGQDSRESSSAAVEPTETETQTGPDSWEDPSSAAVEAEGEEEPEGEPAEAQDGATEEERRDRRKGWWRS